MATEWDRSLPKEKVPVTKIKGRCNFYRHNDFNQEERQPYKHRHQEREFEAEGILW